MAPEVKDKETAPSKDKKKVEHEEIGGNPLSDQDARALARTLVKRNAGQAAAPKRNITPMALAKLLDVIQNDDMSDDMRQELNLLLTKKIKVTEEQLAESRLLLKNPKLFDGYKTPAPLAEEVYGFNKPEEFYHAPGVDSSISRDGRYYPNRFAVNPVELDFGDEFSEGDRVYSVIDDKTFFVLSKEQQSAEYQGRNHMPRSVLIEVL